MGHPLHPLPPPPCGIQRTEFQWREEGKPGTGSQLSNRAEQRCGCHGNHAQAHEQGQQPSLGGEPGQVGLGVCSTSLVRRSACTRRSSAGSSLSSDSTLGPSPGAWSQRASGGCPRSPGARTPTWMDPKASPTGLLLPHLPPPAVCTSGLDQLTHLRDSPSLLAPSHTRGSTHS